MNKASKNSLNFLRFYANHTRRDIAELKQNNPKKYSKLVPDGLEEIFISQGYIHFNGKPQNRTPITRAGLDKLIQLESHQKNELGFWIALIAIIISAIALVKSFDIF